MRGMNLAIVMGNLGRAPEVRYTPGGQAVANFSIATNERWTDKAGNKQEKTEWHRIVVWGKQAEACGEYLVRGSAALVTGRLQTREWTNKEGAKMYTTEIVAISVSFLDQKDKGNRPPHTADVPDEPAGYDNGQVAEGEPDEPADFGQPPAE